MIGTINVFHELTIKLYLTNPISIPKPIHLPLIWPQCNYAVDQQLCLFRFPANTDTILSSNILSIIFNIRKHFVTISTFGCFDGLSDELVCTWTWSAWWLKEASPFSAVLEWPFWKKKFRKTFLKSWIVVF